MSLLTTLLRLGIISGLADRQAFIDKTSHLIEQYYQDPEAAERFARILATYLEDVKDNINMNNAVRKSLRKTDVATKEDMEEIHKALEDLMAEIRKQKEKYSSDDGIS